MSKLQHQQQFYNQTNYNNMMAQQEQTSNQVASGNHLNNFLSNSGQNYVNNTQTTNTPSTPLTYSSNYQKKKNYGETSPHTPKYSPRRSNNNLNNGSFLQQKESASQNQYSNATNSNVNYTSTTPRSSEKYNANGVNSNFSGYISNYAANAYKNGNLSPYNTSSKQYAQLINDQDGLTPSNNNSSSNNNLSMAGGASQLYNSRNMNSANVAKVNGSQKKNPNQFEFIDVENIPQTYTMDLIDKFLKSSSTLQGNNGYGEASTPSERKRFNDMSPFKYSTNKVNNSSTTQGAGLSIIQQQLEIFKQTQLTPSRKSTNPSSQKQSSSYANNPSNQSFQKHQQQQQQVNSSGQGSSSQSSTILQNQQLQQQQGGVSHHHNSSGRHSNAQPSITSSASSNSKVFHQTTTPQQFREPLKNVNNINHLQYGHQQQLREDKLPSTNNVQSYSNNQRNLTPTNTTKKQQQPSNPQQQYMHYQYSNTPQSSKNSYNMIRNGKSTNANQNVLNVSSNGANKNQLFSSANNGSNTQQPQAMQENMFSHVGNKNEIYQDFPLNLQNQSSNKLKQIQRLGCENIQLNTNASNYSGEFGFTPINMQKSTSKVSTFNLDVSRDMNIGHNASNNQIHNMSNNLFNLNFLDKDSSNIFNYHNDKDQSQFSYNFIDKDYSTYNNNVSKELSTFQTPHKSGNKHLSYMLDTSSNLDNVNTNNLTICSTTNNVSGNGNNGAYNNFNTYNTQKTNSRVTNNNNSYILEKSPNNTDQKNLTQQQQQQQYKKNTLHLYDSPRFNNEEEQNKIHELNENTRVLSEEQFQQPSSNNQVQNNSSSSSNNLNNGMNSNNNNNAFQQIISDLKSQYNQKQNQIHQIKQNLDLSSHKKYSNEESALQQPQMHQKVVQEEDLVSKICAQKNIINNTHSTNKEQASPNVPSQGNVTSDTSGKKNQSSTSYTSIKKKNFYEEALQQADQSVKNVFKKFDILLKNKFETMSNSRKNLGNTDDKPNQQQTSATKQPESNANVATSTSQARNNSNTGTSRSSNNISNLNNNNTNSYSYNTKSGTGANPSSSNNTNNGQSNTSYIPSSASANYALLQKDKEREKTPPNNPTNITSDKVSIKPIQPTQKAPSSSSNDKKEPYPIQYHKSLEKFALGKVLGLGSYAVVRVVQDQNTKEKFALKTYEKVKLQDPQKRKNVSREVKILTKMRHRNIIRLYDVIETNSQLHLVMEYPTSTPLNAHIKSKPHRKLCEEEAKIIFSQLVEAVKYCHSKQVVHRDIKLENVLYDAATQKVKLIDFGFSIALATGSKLNIFCGTPSYMAPEIVNKKDYAFPVDTWALGILLFKALNGNFPFRGSDDKELYRRINSCKLEFQSHVSPQARSLLGKILKQNSTERYTPEQILLDEWFQVKTPTNFGSSTQYS